jgi:hypothetical protein
LPFKGCRVVPLKGWDVEDAAWICFNALAVLNDQMADVRL